MHERRQEPRRPTAIFFRNRQWRNYFEVSDRRLGHPVGHLTDITLDGFRLVSSNPVEVDKNFEYRIDLPRKVAGRNRIILETRSVWCLKRMDIDCYETGFRIVSIPPSEESVLKALVGELMSSVEEYQQQETQGQA
jgi:hypothetical protein